MKRNWMTLLVVGGGLTSAMFGQQYPPQYGNGQNGNWGSAGDSAYSDYNEDPNYDVQGMNAPAPPPMPSYAYQRPPMPGYGYNWVDGYWSFFGGRYTWVGGYWMVPPYAGASWVRPRYAGGLYFRGFWGGVRPGFNRGFVRDDFRNQRRYVAPPRRAPAPGRSGFRNDNQRYRGGR